MSRGFKGSLRSSAGSLPTFLVQPALTGRARLQEKEMGVPCMVRREPKLGRSDAKAWKNKTTVGGGQLGFVAPWGPGSRGTPTSTLRIT